MRIASRRDENEPALRQRAQLNGWTWEPVSSPGFPDAVCARDGMLKVVEVKMPKGKLTPAQVETFARLARAGVDVHILITLEDVDRVLPPRARRILATPSRGQ